MCCLLVFTTKEIKDEASVGVHNWMGFYNNRRPHKALGGRPPAVVYLLEIEATQPDQQEQIRA
ncbi:MAG: integrase core domain-containing protein [Rhodobacterales bacterium]